MRSLHFTILFFLCLGLFAQNSRAVDFIKADIHLKPKGIEKEIQGTGVYQFKVQQPVDSLVLDAQNMTFKNIKLGDTEIKHWNTGNQLIIYAGLSIGTYDLSLDYVAIPKQTVYFMGWDDALDGNEQIWTQGQGKYTSHWLPSFDDMTEKVEFDLAITFDEKYRVIANGKLLKKVQNDSLTTWYFDMMQPMSSYLVAFAIGNFDKKELVTASNIPIELYYEPKDSVKAEPTYRYTQEIFDFLETEIGVPYPWQVYKQVPVHDFMYAGMENTTTTIFSDAFVVDSIAFIDKNYVNVNAHELAHQWFGNLVTEVSAEHHWLHEGFATYYAYLAEKQLFGDDYFYWKLYETARTLRTLSEKEDGEALTDPKASSLTFYEKGAWALVMLQETVGDNSFKLGVGEFLKKHAFQNVTITDFMQVMKSASGFDLANFEKQWLYSTIFPWEAALNFLSSKSSSIHEYVTLKSIADEQKHNGAVNQLFWQDSVSNELKRQVILDDVTLLSDSTQYKILNNDSVKVRQALALVIPKITEKNKSLFEHLLNDPSYLTQEAVLFKLWETFPENRNTYLNKTKNIQGLPNQSIKLLWLTLALITPDYEPEKKNIFYAELNGFTGSEYHFEVRQLAFQYLSQINALSDTSLINLFRATNHHVWQFKKTSRDLLSSFIKRKENKERLISVGYLLSDQEKELLSKFLNP